MKMWTRKELKEQGRVSFKRNYWRSVIVAFLISMVIGGGAGFSAFHNGINRSYNQADDFDTDIEISGYPDNTTISIDGENLTLTGDIANDLAEDLQEAGISEITPGDLEDFAEEAGGISGAALGAAIAFGALAVFFVTMIILALILAFNAFVVNPFIVGGQRFFVRNLNEEASVSNIGYAYDNNYKNVALTMFFKDLYTILWGLLFIIPGIVKAYEYRMIPYLLADDPTMTQEQAFAISKEMMTGNKWKAFVLDLSFLGWHILSLFTAGILEIFWVSPYEYATDAALYRKLLAIRGSEQQDEVQPVYADTISQETQADDEL